MPQPKPDHQPIRPPPSRQAEKEHGGFCYPLPFQSYPFQTLKPKGEFDTWQRPKPRKSRALKKKSDSLKTSADS